jgi:ABC-type antimicrobial peptide transport system permease subunit
VRPLIVSLGKDGLTHFLVRLTTEGRRQGQIAAIEKIARTLNPSYPFTYTYTDDNYRQFFFGKTGGLVQLINIFGGMAILISCLGLYGLATFLVEKRSKEICVRRILGAGTGGIWLSLSREFLRPVVLGFVIAAPLAALALSKMLSSIEYRIGLSWWIFAVAGGAVLVLALATVSYHGIRAVRLKPAETLRAE